MPLILVISNEILKMFGKQTSFHLNILKISKKRWSMDIVSKDRTVLEATQIVLSQIRRFHIITEQSRKIFFKKKKKWNWRIEHDFDHRKC